MMDYSANFASKRMALNEETGGQYRAFLQTLSPRFSIVWRDIAFGYAMLALTLYGIQLFQAPYWFLLSIPAGALLVGYFIAYLQLFIHEAAHYNLASDKKMNDLLGDIFIAWQVGSSIKDYRAKHFPHHLKLGQADDPEASYFYSLTPRFLIEMLTGIHSLRVFMLQRKSGREQGRGKPLVPVLRGLCVHLALLALLVYLGAWSSALAWMGGVGVIFPVFGTLRPLLEHRAPEAVVQPDGSREGLTRIFGDGAFASTFGGAGFNRHLLHHWEPTVSYTRLSDYEKYLMTTSMAPVIRERHTTYWKTLVNILKADNAKHPHAT